MIILLFCYSSVATTSTKPPAVLKTDIRRVLDRMTVQYRETQTGFDCIHLPSIDISSLHDPHGAPQKTRDLGGATPQQQQPHVSPPPTGGVTDPEVSESVGRNMLSVRFEINIVKVRTFSFLRLLSHLVDLVLILISFLGPMVAVTWNPIPPCGRRRMAVPDDRTSSPNGVKALIQHVWP